MAHRPVPPTLIALFGPTSSGKTRISVELAQQIWRNLGTEPVIISADSRQVYRYMDIGTSKTMPEDTQGVRHEMIDVTEPVQKFYLESYVKLAGEHISECFRTGKVPLIVGGTGIYVNALLRGWTVEHFAAARESLRSDFPRAMLGDAYRTLRRLDRSTAARVHPKNYEGIINALATVMSGTHDARTGTMPGVHHVVLGLDPGQPALDTRVARTYDDQMRRGLFDEIRALTVRYDLDREMRRRGKESHNQVLHTHGYREFFELAVARGKLVDELDAADLTTVREHVVRHVRMYSRRQRAWFRKLPRAHMIRSAAQGLSVLTADARQNGS